MAFIPMNIKNNDSGGDTPTSYSILTISTGSTSAAIRVGKINDQSYVNDILYTAANKYLNFGDILIDYGITASGKWTVKVNGNCTVIYNNTEYKNGAIILQWNYYTSVLYLLYNEQSWKYHYNNIEYNVTTKSATSSSAIITVYYYNNGSLISSTDITTQASSNPVYIGNIKITYSTTSPYSYQWLIYTRYSDTIIECNGMYTTSTDNPIINWVFSDTKSYSLRECV